MQNKNVNNLISKYLPQIHKNGKKIGKNYSLDEYAFFLKEKIDGDLKSNINKNDIKIILKKLMNKKTKGVDEFVDSDGSYIEGDWNPNKREIFVGKDRPETSREFAMFTAQGPRYYYTPHYGASRVYTRESIAESKMKSMIEDILSADKSKDSDILSNVDFENNSFEIPELSELKSKHQRPIIARKAKYLGDMMQREGVSGEEIAIIFNYLFSQINLEEIPLHYKKELIKKLKNV